MENSGWNFDQSLQQKRSALQLAEYDVYCLFCLSGSEIRLANELNQVNCNFLALPLLRTMHKSKNGVRSLVQDVLLKGYVFLFVPAGTDISTLKAAKTAFRVLERENGRGLLSGSDRQYAKWVFSQGGLLDVSKAVNLGGKVKIIEGPLLDLAGNIKEYSKKNRNCHVQIEIVGKQLSVWLPFDWVVPESETLGTFDAADA